MARKSSGRSNGKLLPLSNEEILTRENIPAAGSVPQRMLETFSRSRVYCTSDDDNFDPRKNFTRVKGARGTWELSLGQPISSGLPIKKIGQFASGSLKSKGGADALQGFRPRWQPYIYHPKAIAAPSPHKVVRRKNGAKVFPDIVFNYDDRQLFYPAGYPWQSVGRLFVSSSPRR